jgi:hypothetical protein
MERRQLLGLLGAGTAGLIAMTGSEAFAQREAPAQHPHHHDPVHGECQKACLRCAEVCNETFHYSFGHLKDGHKEHAEVAALTLDCQEFCSLAAGMLARESPMMGHSCAACAEVCKACAEECKKHDDKQLKECAEACLACEKSCRAMVEHAKDHQHHTG